MENVRLAPSDSDEDLYSGYNKYPSAFSTKDLEQDEVFQEAVRTSYGKRPIMATKPGTAMRLGTSSMHDGSSTAFRPVTSLQDGINRPMTAVRGAGYTSQRPSTVFDPLNQASKLPNTLELKKEEMPEEKIKKLERKIMELIEEACIANSVGEHRTALEKAKEASSKERSLIRMQEQAGLSETHNLDLTFSVLFNLANQYAVNEMYSEALNTYQVITKNRMFNNANRLKMNMGNIYFKLGQYPKAVKMYKMALDQVPNTHRELRIKIMHNIGILFVKTGQFNDACSSFEYIMQEKPEFTTGLHLIVCHYALGDKEKMKRSFQMLVEVPLNIEEEEKFSTTSDDPRSTLIMEVIKNDSLCKIERQMKEEAERSILTAAKLISPVIEDSFGTGYDWCVDVIKTSVYAHLANDLEINKAVMYMKQKDLTQAIDTLKSFEKKETKVASTAATNLAFIFFLQGEIEKAEKYAEQAREADSYNSAAYVNLGNCCMVKGDLDKAKELYICALENDASCVEALYNLGLVNKQKGNYNESLDCFHKLQTIVKHHPQVLYQLAHLYELHGDVEQATEWYLQVIGLVPSDPNILQKMGEMFDNEGDKQQAYQYHFDSYRYFPSNFEVIDWLGSYFIEMQVAEKAISYFERASFMHPGEVKWKLMIASCNRRSGNYHQALNTYKDIHKAFPENIECLKFLVRICSDLGLEEAAEYAQALKKAEKAKEIRERIGSSRPGYGSLHRGTCSLSSDLKTLDSRRSSRLSGSALSSRGGSAMGTSPVSDIGSAFSAGNRGGMSSASRSIMSSDMKLGKLTDGDLEFAPPNPKDLELGYADPLGPMAERPRTSAGLKLAQEDEFGDEELGDDLLPV